MRKAIVVTIAVFLVLSAASLPSRSDWYIVQDALSGAPQAIWSAPTPSGDEDIFYSRLSGATWVPPSGFIATDYAPGSLSVVADSAGAVKVAWGTAGTPGRVMLRSVATQGGLWGPEVAVSNTAEQSERPSIAVHGGSAYVGYEVVQPNGSRIVKVGKVDSGGAVERTLLSGGSAVPRLDVRLHEEGGHLWAEWTDSTGSLGYSALQSASWQSPQFEPFAGAADLDAARARIRARVLGLP